MAGPRAKAIPERKDDWVWAQFQYESTNTSAQDIAAIIGVSHTAFLDRVNRGAWTRDKKKVVLKETAQIVAEASMLNRARIDELRKEKLEIIERVNVLMQAEVLKQQRTDIGEVRAQIRKLFSQLAIAGPEDDEATYLEELEARAKVLEKLVNSMSKVILLERQAYGITNALEEPEVAEPARTPDEQLVNKVMEKFANVAKRMSKEDKQEVIDVSIKK